MIPFGNEHRMRNGALVAVAAALVMFAIAAGWLLWLVGWLGQ